MTDTRGLDPEAAEGLNSLYRRYAGWLNGRLRAHVDADRAADVVQDTYLRAAPYRLGDIRYPRAFLLRIAMNLVRDESRRRKRQALEANTGPPDLSEAASQVDQLLLKQIVLTMPALYRDVFVLSRFGGMGCRHANCAPETLPVGETGVARARADRPEGDRPTCTSLPFERSIQPIAGAEGRGDRSVRRRSRFTLSRARAEPLVMTALTNSLTAYFS